MFSDADVLNVVLQRSAVLFDVPRGGRLIRQWSDGNAAPLEAVVKDKGRDLIRCAIAYNMLEYRDVAQHLKGDTIAKATDIGCGYAFFDLFLYRDHTPAIALIDIEESETRDFGYQAEGAGYSSLAKAKAFLTENGGPADAVRTINPKDAPLPSAQDTDLIFSLLSCGFHYPLSTYTEMIAQTLKPRGALVIDVRTRNLKDQQAAIDTVGTIAASAPLTPKVDRIFIRRPAGD